MSSVLTITVKGVAKSELDKNFEIVDSYMNSKQTNFKLVSSTRPNFNPRIYFSEETVISKIIHDIIDGLKTDKSINTAIRKISFAGHLSNV